MPWEIRGSVEQRLEFVEQAINGDLSFKELCQEYGVSRVSGYKWLNRYREGQSVEALRDKSRRPLSSPNQTNTKIETRVRSLFEEYQWGPKKIRKLLENEGTKLPLITVRRIYKRYGLKIEEPGVQGPALRRFEREAPNELVQMDYKGQFMTDDQSWCFPLSLLDDHSRYCVGLFALTEQSGNTAEKCIVETFENYGVPKEMLMDHGSPWWNSNNGWGLTKLSVKLMRQGIKLRFSGVRHPQTQGKVERFHRTLKQELRRQKGKFHSIRCCATLLEDFRKTYNSIRPHEALNFNTPASRYVRSPRTYNPNPTEWEYPEGSTILKLDTLGRVSYENRRFFVCEALAEQSIRIVPLEASALVVYRNMAIRELDLDTGSSIPSVFPVDKNFSALG